MINILFEKSIKIDCFFGLVFLMIFEEFWEGFFVPELKVFRAGLVWFSVLVASGRLGCPNGLLWATWEAPMGLYTCSNLMILMDSRRVFGTD